MITPPETHIGRDRGNGSLILLFGSGRQVQLELLALRRGRAKQTGIEVLEFGRLGVHALGHQPQIYGVVDGHSVVSRSMIHGSVVQPILRRILGHDGDRQDDRHIVARFFGKHVAPIELPEIGETGALYCCLHRAGTGVVGGYRQVPVAKLVVKVFQMPCGRARSLLGILTFVDPPTSPQAIPRCAA